MVPIIFSYIYYFLELISASISQYQSIFIVSDDSKKNIKSFKIIILLLSIGYIFLFGAIFFSYFFDISKLSIFSLASKYLGTDIEKIFDFNIQGLILIIIFSLNIFLMQVMAYARYAYHLHSDFKIVSYVIFFAILNFLLGYFIFLSYGYSGIIYSSILLFITLVLSVYLFRRTIITNSLTV